MALHAVEWPGTVILAHPLEGEEDPLDTYSGGSAAGGTRRMSGSGGRGRRNAASSQVAVPWLIADGFDWWNGSSWTEGAKESLMLRRRFVGDQKIANLITCCYFIEISRLSILLIGSWTVEGALGVEGPLKATNSGSEREQ